MVDYSINTPPTRSPPIPTKKAFLLREVAAAIYPSSGPNAPLAPVAPGDGAPAVPPPPETSVGAVGRLLGVVVEVDVALPLDAEPVAVELPEAVWLEDDGVMVKVRLVVLVTVLGCLSGPKVTKVEREAEVMTVREAAEELGAGVDDCANAS